MEHVEYTGWPGGLYVIQNLVERRLFYVGSSQNIKKRWAVHKALLNKGKHHSKRLQSDWFKYGEAAFSILPLQMIEGKQDRLRLEQHFLTTLPCPYNVSRKANSSEGTVRSDATREKLRVAVRRADRMAHIKALGGAPKSPEHRARIAEAHLGMRPSEETRAKLRAASAARWARPEEREKIRAARRAKKGGTVG